VSEIRYFTDENVSRAVINGLRQRGVDIQSVPEVAMIGASDEEILAYAFQEGRVLYTQDDDFLGLDAAGHEHAGIVYAHQYTPIGEIIRGLMLIFQILEAEEMVGQVEFL